MDIGRARQYERELCRRQNVKRSATTDESLGSKEDYPEAADVLFLQATSQSQASLTLATTARVKSPGAYGDLISAAVREHQQQSQVL